MKSLYENVGKKIMMLAQVIAWIAGIGGGITGFIMMPAMGELWFVGLFVLIGSALLMISTWFMYGFGQLIDQVDTITKGQQNAPVAEELPEL